MPITWDEVEALAEEFPWAVIDPSVLIGHKTPLKFEDLADEENPLWRQYYIDWAIQSQGSTLTRDTIKEYLHLLTKSVRHRKEKTKVAEEFAERRRKKAKKELAAQGSLDDFHQDIRRIKDAIEKYAKENHLTVSEVGVRFAGTAVDAGFGDLDGDKVIGQGLLHMLNGPSKADYIGRVNDAVQHFNRLGELAPEWEGLEAVKDVLAKAHGQWQHWEGILRDAFGNYEKALDYMAADENGRKEIKQRDPDEYHQKLYARVDEGQLRIDLSEIISRYGQAMLAEWTTVAGCFAAFLTWAKFNAEKMMRENFEAAFKEASAGILAAKTAVGVTSAVLGFFPPFGPLIGGGLTLCMNVAETVAKEILIAQSSRNPDVIISYMGTEFGREIPESDRKKLAEFVAEHGLTALEGLENLAHLAEKAADLGVELSPYLTEMAKEAAKARLDTMAGVMPVVGGVLTVASLTFEWTKFGEAQKKVLKDNENLTHEHVVELQELTKGAFAKERANEEWHPHLNNARLLYFTNTEFGVRINGVDGTINRQTRVFSPSNRAKAWNTMLAAAKDKTDVTYRGARVVLDLSKPTEMYDSGTSLVCTVTGTCHGYPCYMEKFDFIIAVTADGNLAVRDIKAPTFAELVDAATKKSPAWVSLSHNSKAPNEHLDPSVYFLVDWANTSQVHAGQWQYECTAPAVVDSSHRGKYQENSRWDVRLELPFTGDPHILDTSKETVKPTVQAEVVRAVLRQSHESLLPPPENPTLPTYAPDWDNAEFSDFDRENSLFQIKNLPGYIFETDAWDSLQGICAHWDFEHKTVRLDRSKMTITFGVDADKIDELEKYFTRAVEKKPRRDKAKTYKKSRSANSGSR